ncbi:MAG TPA: PAS domain-containing protein [Vicinamibacterales bacterium]|nr:PAS domain-containing protein [Vicinamibacterales bacterium]
MLVLRRALFTGLMVTAALLPPGRTTTLAQSPAAISSSPRRSVLVLYSTRRGGVVEAVSDPILRRMIVDGLNGAVDYFPETIDILRASDRGYQEALAHFLAQKYADQKFDLFVAIGDAAFAFLSRFRGHGAVAVPFVFSVATETKPPPNATGIISGPHFRDTLESALALHPGTRRVAVISGASQVDRDYEAQARAEFKALEGRVQFDYLGGLPIAAALNRVAHLPPHSILLLTTFAEDSEGRNFTTLDITERLSRAANAPMYSWVNVSLGQGIVGGRMASQEVLIARAGDLALRVLRGEAPATIPVQNVDWTTTQYDWRQLRRWGIDEARLPRGAQVLFRPQTIWKQYGSYALAGGALLLLQAGFIVTLLIQRAGRRKAQMALRESEERFRLMADTAPVLIWRAGIDKGCDFFNSPWLEFTGRPLEQELGTGWMAGVHPEDLQGCIDQYAAAFEARQMFRIEFRLRRADGEYRWLMDTGVPRYDDRNQFAGYVGSCIDVTDYRQAMEDFSESQRQQQQLAGKLIDAQERERARLARELHDDINQQLAGLAIFQSGIRRRAELPAGGLSLAADLRFLQERTATVVESIRSMSRGLHPVMIEHAGLVAALSAHCRELERTSLLRFEFTAEGNCDKLGAAARLCLYRSAQEALRNAVAHASASQITVRLRCDGHNGEVTIADDGQGFDERVVRRQADGLGLISIQERARLAGGTFCVVTEKGKGSSITVRIPVQ